MTEEETADDIKEKMSVKFDLDGEEGPLPPVEIEFELGKNAYFLISLGIIIGLLIRHGIATLM